MRFSEVDLATATVEGIDPGSVLQSSVVVPASWSEVRVFCLFLWRFGHPNGFMTYAIGGLGDPDAPYKYDFTFNVPEFGTMDLVRSSQRLEFWSRGSVVEPEELLGFIEKNMERYSDEIDAAKAELEEYVLLVNPYWRHSNIAKIARRSLEALDTTPPIKPDSGECTREEMDEYFRLWGQYFQAVSMESLYSMLLVTESVYCVESLLNFILAVFAKTEIKEDAHVFRETRRRRWKDKLRRLHIDCDYITQCDLGTQVVVDLERGFQLRNRVAHSYPDIEEMRLDTIWFWNRIPVLAQPTDFERYVVDVNNRLPSASESIEVHDACCAGIEMLFGLVDQEVNQFFRVVADSNPLGFNKKHGIYSRPFSDAFVQAFGGKD